MSLWGDYLKSRLRKPLHDWLHDRALRFSIASRVAIKKRIPVLTDDDFEFLTEYMATNASNLIDEIKI